MCEHITVSCSAKAGKPWT